MPMVAQSSLDIIYEPTDDASFQVIRDGLIGSGLETLIEAFVNDTFVIVEELPVIFGVDDGPLYEPGENTIYMPYYFSEEVSERFEDADYEDTGVSVKQATEDAIIHTIFHELAHALIFNFSLPITGKEEDAADELASVLLIEYFEGGQEIALSAADLFDLESMDTKTFEEEDFWGEHSLDNQRFYNTVCLVYGSEPNEYAGLLEALDISRDRGDRCIDDYERVVRSWDVILRPH